MTDYRSAVVQAAISQLGQSNLAEYWADALGKPTQTAPKLAWCGIFALRCLHVAGLAQHVHWVVGRGFLSQPDGRFLLPMTDKPLPGDVGYLDKPWQHHYLVESVETDRVHSIDGNSGAHSTVNRATHPIGGCVYFSIAPLIALVGAQDALPKLPHYETTSATFQHAVNGLIMQHIGEPGAPKLMTVSGDIGILDPESVATIKWAQEWFHLAPTGDPNDVALLHKLGLAGFA